MKTISHNRLNVVRIVAVFPNENDLVSRYEKFKGWCISAIILFVKNEGDLTWKQLLLVWLVQTYMQLEIR